jgi:hypothetical protein
MKTIDETEETQRGELIVQLLNLKPSRRDGEAGRVDTEWGTKTPLGLYRTLKRIIEEGK